MNTGQAQALTVTAVAVSAGLATVAHYTAPARHRPLPEVWVGACIGGVMLSVLAQLAPSLAGPLALLVLGSSVFAFGGDAYTGLTNVTAGNHPTHRAPTGPLTA